MSSATVYRLSGLALLIGGALAVTGAIAQAVLADDYRSPLWIPVAVAIFIGTLLVQVGLPAVYVRQMQSAGRLGLIGFILLFCGAAQFGIGFRFFDIAILPWFGNSADSNPPLSFILYSLSAVVLLLVGSILFGLATVRAGVLPKGPVVLLLGGLVLNRIGSHLPYLQDIGGQDIGGVLFYLAFVWFGWALLSLLRRDVARAPAPAPTGTEVRA